MAKQIVVLETNPADGGFINIRCCFWFPVTVGQELPRPDLVASAWKAAAPGDLSALQAGTILEEVNSYRYPSSFTAANIKTELVAAYNARKAYLLSIPFQGQYYGVFFDSVAGWSA